MRTNRLFLVAALFVAADALPGQAINGRTTGLSDPSFTIDFNTPPGPDNTPVTTQYSGQGVTFAGVYYGSTNSYGGGVYTTGALYNFYPCCTNPVFINFLDPVLGAAFNFESNPGSTLFTAFLGGTQVGQFQAFTNLENAFLFYGFENLSFDSIEILTDLTTNQALGLDNLEVENGGVSPVPEPASIMLLATGLVGVIGTARRRLRRDSVT